MSKSPGTHVVGVRMPNALYAKIAKLAASEHRSVSNLVVKALLESFGEETKRANGAHKPDSKHVAA